MSWSSVITNKEQFLDEVINKILPSADKVSFLVGFFYFSGFQHIYKNLVGKKVRILIGMDVEQTIRDLKFKFSDDNSTSISGTLKNFKELVNKTDIFESQEALEAMHIFIQKIQDWSLEIRQTLSPNHAKIYLFENGEQFSQWGTFPGTMITWSGNLTYSGLHGQGEFNIVMREPEWFNEALSYFNNIWENESIPLTTWGEDDEVVKMLKNETWLKLSSPYYCYMRLLNEYFQEKEDIKMPSDITADTFQDLEYQVDAIKKALRIIDEHNGVMIADVVWLGKSIIWSTILHNLDEKAIIIAPPHLVDQRNDYKKAFGFEAEIFSSGKIDKAYDRESTSIHKSWVVLIDEAHKYRNADTQDYGYLHQLCQWKKVVLLTATPFNNQPNDIFNLIKLFQIPNNPTIHTKKWLLQEFTSLQTRYEEVRKTQRADENSNIDEEVKDIASAIRQIIWPVVVRRSRVDLDKISAYKEDLKKQGYQFSKVADPIELQFDLSDLEDLYISTLERLTEVDERGEPVYFRGARYKVLTYLTNYEPYTEQIEKTLWYDYTLLEWRQKNMPFFMRRLLVSRFESSIAAFKETVKSLIRSIDHMQSYVNTLHWAPVIKKWWLPDIEDLADAVEDISFDEASKQEVLDELAKKQWILIDIKDLDPAFVQEMEKDKEFLEALLYEWEQVDTDPKLDVFVERLQALQQENPDRKIVVFSQYTATIDYLASQLTNFRILKVTGSTKTEELKASIKFNFDAWVPVAKQKNDYDILLGTDAISEWYNLHRAGIIVNYDIPYNPTRVIQRIWRINRINKKVYDTLYIYNYFPSLVGEQHISTKKISTLKIRMMATILGIDVKTLTEYDEIGSFYRREMIKGSSDEQELSRDTLYLEDFKNAKFADPELMQKIGTVPERTKIQRTATKDTQGVILFAKKANNLLFQFYDAKLGQTVPITLSDAFALFKADLSEEPKEVSADFYDRYARLKEQLKAKEIVQDLNSQEKKALENVKKMYAATKNPYFQKLQKVIEYRALPRYYMKNIRKITENNFQEESKALMLEVSEKYLQGIIDAVNNYDEESQDLIITQEFIS